MIIIEGPDGVGKSTLAKALARKFRAPQVCFSPLPDWWTDLDYVARMMPFAVYDRYHWSAYAYKEISPQPWNATVERCIELDDALRVRCIQRYTTVCVLSGDNKWFDDRPRDEMFNLDAVKKANDAFMNVSQHFNKVWHVDQEGWPNLDALEITRV